LAEPVLNPQTAERKAGPLLLVIDDGWTAAPRWRDRLVHADNALERAERDGRPAMLITTAPDGASGDVPRRLMPAAELRPVVAALQPKPWASDRDALLQELLRDTMPEDAEVVWLADGLRDDETGEAAYVMAEWLLRLGSLRVMTTDADDGAVALLPPVSDPQGDLITLRRPEGASGDRTMTLRALTDQGRVLARETATFADGSATADVRLSLPGEIRNQLSRLELEEQPSAGSVQLLDERWRRRPVGLVSGGGLETRQPLLGDLFYLERALAPYAELRQGRIAELLERELAVIILADVAQVVGSDEAKLQDWIRNGGVLLRFAGPRMAETDD